MGHAKHQTADQDVLPAVQCRIQARAKRQDRADAPAHLDRTGGLVERSGNDAQECRFSGAVASDDTDYFAASNIERYISESPMLSMTRPLSHRFEQHVERACVDSVDF